MSVFTVFSFKHPKYDIGAAFNALTSAAHIHPTKVIKHTMTSSGRSVSVHALSTDTGFYTVDQQHWISPTSATMMSGYVFNYDQARPEILDAQQLNKQFRPTDFDDRAGEYALCHITASELIALADPEGIQNLFYIDTPDVFAISTRPSMLSIISGRRDTDRKALTWTTAIGYRVGQRSTLTDIKSIPQGQTLVWNGKFRFEQRRTALNRDHSDGISARPGWFDHELDKAIHAASNAVQLVTENERIELAITGGKDSRLVLALCLAGGLKDKISLYTNGADDHPDVIVGAMIAERVGVPHRKDGVKTGLAVLPDADAFVSGVKEHAFQVDGLSGAWDNWRTARVGTTRRLSGHMGEVLKAYAKRPFDSSRPIDPIAMVKLQAPFDPMAVLLPGIEDELRDELSSLMVQHLGMGFTYGDLPDLFYYANRIPNWLGVTRQVQNFASETVMPIGVPPLMRMAFCATAEERKAERIHFEIIKRLAPELLEIPFAAQHWHPSLDVREVKAIELSSPNQTPMFGTWQFALNKDERLRKVISEHLLSREDSVLWQSVSRERLIARLGGPPFSMMELISFLGFLSSFYFDTMTYTTRKVENPNAPDQIQYHFSPVQKKQSWTDHLRKIWQAIGN